MIPTRKIVYSAAMLACIASFLFPSISAQAMPVEIFSENFNGYSTNPGFPGSSNDIGGHRTIFGVPTQAAGANSDLWLAARFEYFDDDPLSDDVGVLKYGSGSPTSGAPYNNPAGRIDDDAGLVIKLDLTEYTDVELDFDWRTFATESNDRLVAAYFVGDGLGDAGGAYDWFNDPALGNGDLSASDPNGAANTWYVNNWTEVLRDTSPSSFQQESGISLPGGDVLYLAFWLDNGNHDLGKIDNIVISGVHLPSEIPEPSTLALLAIGCTCGIFRLRTRRS